MSATDIFVTGHGGFSEARGYAVVLPKMEVRLYQEFGENIPSATVRKWLLNAEVDLGIGGDGQAKATIAAGMSIPNLVIAPLNDQTDKFSDERMFLSGKVKYLEQDGELNIFLLQPHRKISLAELMSQLRTHRMLVRFDLIRLHWLACLANITQGRARAAPAPAPATTDDPFAEIVLEEW